MIRTVLSFLSFRRLIHAMPSSNQTSLVRWVLMGLVGVVPVAAHAQSAHSAKTDVLRAVQETYNDLESLRATFTQTVVPPFGGDSTRTRGVLLLQGNRYRVETLQETFVTDGTTTWMYVPADSQVVVNTATDNPAAVSPQTLFMDYTDRYSVVSVQSTMREGAAHQVLTLRPLSDATRFRSLRLWVRSRDTMITRLRLEDPSASMIRISFDDIVKNPSVDASDFRFEPPSGIEVIDLRSS